MSSILSKIISNEQLSFDESKQFIYDINDEKYNETTIGGILVGIQMRGVKLEELNGFRTALLELTIPIELDSDQAIDLCGTGGDGKDTFNISTTTAFVLAAMGKKVIKHGNYGVSSLCGSSNVLEALGIEFTNDNKTLEKNLEQKNICFLHAPLFHPAMKKVAPIRRNLGIRSVFNSLGPLVNPAQPNYQLTGTYSLELAKIYQHILQGDRTDFTVAYGMDGYDEITLTDDTRLLSRERDEILNANSLSIEKVKQSALLSGNSIHHAAKILKDILNGKGTKEQNEVVAANVASALKLYHPSTAILDLFNESISFIQSGQSSTVLSN